MLAICLALTASVAWGASDFLGGISSRSYAVLTVLTVSQPAGLMVIAVAVAVHGQLPVLGISTVWAVAAGLCSVGSLGSLYLAMSRGDMVLIAPLASIGVVIPVGVGLVEGNKVTVLIVLGFVLAIIGTLATTWSAPEPGSKEKKSNVAAALLALGSAAGQGLFLVTLNHASSGDPFTATAIARVVSCAITLLAFLAFRRSVRAPASMVSAPAAASDDGPAARSRAPWIVLAAAGAADAIAEVTFAWASTSGELSISAVLSSLYPLVTMLLAMIFLRERMRAIQGIGAVSVVVGVVLLSIT
jgi:drug/metabolite transporter (DMT)-like permease